MLKTRIITASILIVGFLFALFNSTDIVWKAMTLGITLLGIWEWSNLIKLNKVQMICYLLIALAVGLILLLIPRTPFAAFQQPIVILLLEYVTFFWLLIAPVWLKTRAALKHKLLMGLLGLVLLIATWLGLVGLHMLSPWLLLGVIAAVSLADSAAYFAGKRFGRHKLAPEISPGKTWEGVAGAVVAVTFYGVVLCFYQHYSYWLIIGLWLIVFLSVMGDLFESLLKRQAGIKDSSHLLPGHGGVLDRIDGLIPTLPISLLCCAYLPFLQNSSIFPKF